MVDVKRSKRIAIQNKTLDDIKQAVHAFARAHKVPTSEVKFRLEGGWRSEVHITCTSPETDEEKERRLTAERRRREAAAREARRQERFAKERDQRHALNTMTNYINDVEAKNRAVTEALITLLNTNKKLRTDVLKKVTKDD